jgi:hypothetical protein
MSAAVLGVLTPSQLPSREEYLGMLQALCNYPTLIPDVYDVCEPIRELFDQSNVNHVADTVCKWRKGFIWKRRKPKSWGAIYPNYSPTPEHTNLTLHATIGKGTEETDVIGLLKDWSRMLGADFGFVEAELPKPDPTRPSLFVHSRDLLEKIPQLFWGAVFGPPYVELFGRDRLRSVPAAVKIELAPNLFYIQLTDRLNDTIERPEMVDKARQAAKEHLGIDAFVIARGAATAACLPTFSFVTPQPAA